MIKLIVTVILDFLTVCGTAFVIQTLIMTVTACVEYFDISFQPTFAYAAIWFVEKVVCNLTMEIYSLKACGVTFVLNLNLVIVGWWTYLEIIKILR